MDVHRSPWLPAFLAVVVWGCGDPVPWEVDPPDDSGVADSSPDTGWTDGDADGDADAAADGGGGDGGLDGAAPGDGAPPLEAGPDAGDGGPGPLPVESLDELRLLINIGDSLAAGYNATGRNRPGGHGNVRLLLDNHPSYPDMAGHHLSALFPSVDFRDLSQSGATSADALEAVRRALGGSLPAAVDGDVLVTLICGGNDFNDDWVRMALPAATRAVAAALQTRYREIFRLLRERYERPELGRRVVFLVTNVHDPTGGTGSVPPEFDDGFCGTIQSFPAAVRSVAVANLGIFNEAIAEVTAELGGHLVDNHAVFLDHGMSAGPDRWIDRDCVHPTDRGHDGLRRRHWQVLTGEAR